MKASHSTLILSAVIGLIFLTGCQSYPAKLLDPQATAADFSRRRLDSPALHSQLVASGHWSAKQSWPPSSWRLRELQGIALCYHPEISVAKAKAATALAAITTADTAPNPIIGFTPEHGNFPGPGLSPWVLGFTVDVPIETAGKRKERTTQARAAANSAILGVADKAWTIVSAVRSALVDLESTTQRLRLLEEQQRNDDEVIATLTARVAAGEAPHSEVALFQSQRSRNAIDLADGRAKAEAARAKLADALGVPGSSLTGAPFSFGALDALPEPPAEKTLKKAALQQRADVLGALEDYAAADAGLRLEIAKQYPDLHLNPGYTFDQGQSKWALGIGLTLPVDHNRGPIREAIAKRDEAAAMFERVQIGIRGELDQALSAYQADRSRLKEIKRLLAAQEKEANNAEELSKSGESNRGTVLESHSLVVQAQLAVIDAATQAQQSLGQLQAVARIQFGNP
jgi:outer membrane protein TolC